MEKKKVSDFLYETESYKIRGACFQVYNTLGGGIKENIVVRALAKELTMCGLRIERETRINVLYRSEKVGIYIPDIIINGRIIIEVKSKPYFTKEDEKQFWGYLKGSKYKLGFLVNFGPQKILIKRFVHTNKSA